MILEEFQRLLNDFLRAYYTSNGISISKFELQGERLVYKHEPTRINITFMHDVTLPGSEIDCRLYRGPDYFEIYAVRKLLCASRYCLHKNDRNA